MNIDSPPDTSKNLSSRGQVSPDKSSGQLDPEKASLDTSVSDFGDLFTMSPQPQSSTSSAPVSCSPPLQPVSSSPLSRPAATPPAVSSTVHQNPNWLAELKRNFHAEVIEPCSARARDAVENDEDIEVGIKGIELYFIIFLRRMIRNSTEFGTRFWAHL